MFVEELSCHYFKDFGSFLLFHIIVQIHALASSIKSLLGVEKAIKYFHGGWVYQQQFITVAKLNIDAQKQYGNSQLG